MNAGTRDGSHGHDPLTIRNQSLFFLYIEKVGSLIAGAIENVSTVG